MKLFLDKMMYENGESVSENAFSQTSPTFNPSNFSIGIEIQQQMRLNIDHFTQTQLIQEMGHDLNNLPLDDQQAWDNEMNYNAFTTQNSIPQEANNMQYIDMQNGHQPSYNPSSLSDFTTLYPPNMLPFVNQALTQENLSLTSELLGSNLVYESPDMFHQSLGNGSYLIGEGSTRAGSRGKGIIKTKEKLRREEVKDKFQLLRSLLPNPQKSDKASIIQDAILYIKELLRTESEFKILVEKKRHARERNKRQKQEQDDVEGCNLKLEPYVNGGLSSLRSSWLQRKTKDAEVDVRIVDDDATIKLAQKKKTNCLLIVSKALDELQLDIQHVAGGLVGDSFSFLFNTKICEGSCVYASAIATKIIEAVENQYAAIQPGNNC